MIKCNYALIGGSSTCSISFPADLNRADIRIVEKQVQIQTPFGESPPFTIFELNDQRVITCRMHGWRGSIPRGTASQQIFWTFREAGVQTILAEGGVGSLKESLKPGDIIIPHDYIDLSQRRGVSIGDDFLMIMRNPLCPDLRSILCEETTEESYRHVIDSGIYIVTEGRHFESRAEISLFSRWGADVVGQSLAPEVYLAREIGACYAGIYLVVNFAEGITGDWSHETLTDLFYSESFRLGNVLINALKRTMRLSRTCTCASLRKPSLLKKHLSPEGT